MIHVADPFDVADHPTMDAATHLEKSLQERWTRYRKAFARCAKKLSEDSVHQSRVETRRLLALLDLLETWARGKELAALRRGLKKSFKSFARLRDTQVQLLFLEKHRRRFPEAGRFADTLARLEQRLVRKLGRKVRRTGRKELKQRMTALGQVLDAALDRAGLREQGRRIVTEHVSASFARVVALRRRIRPARPLTIHRTRVAFKKFRYLVELLQPLLPGVGLCQLQEMHNYQTLMGEIQDLEVLQAGLEAFAAAEGETVALERFQREIQRQHAALISRYMARADQLFEFWPPGGHSRQTMPARSAARRSSRPGATRRISRSAPHFVIRLASTAPPVIPA